MKILIVEPYLSGHYLEYINHIHQIARSYPNHDFVFVLSPQFHKVKGLLEWPICNNIKYDFSLPIQNLSGNPNSLLSSLKKSIQTSRRISKYVKQYSPNYLFSIDLMSLVPFLPFFVRKVSVIGVVYSI